MDIVQLGEAFYKHEINSVNILSDLNQQWNLEYIIHNCNVANCSG